MVEMMKLLPKLGQLLALVKNLPSVINELQRTLRQMEAVLVELQKVVPQYDMKKANAILEQGVAALQQAEDLLTPILGAPSGSDVR
jgi:exonuclease VII small subunit